MAGAQVSSNSSGISHSSHTFTTKESSAELFEQVLELKPGRVFDATFYLLEKRELEAEEALYFIKGALDAFYNSNGMLNNEILPHPEAIMRTCEAVLQAKKRYIQLNEFNESNYDENIDQNVGTIFAEASSLLVRQKENDRCIELIRMYHKSALS